MDNFKVSQWLELALADGSAYVYTRLHKGNGHLCYKEPFKMYQNDAKEKNQLQELHKKVKNVTYHGAKNFPFEKFGNALKTYYDKMAVLGEPVSSATQVQQMLDSIHHSPTKQVAVDIVFHTPDVEGDLSMALSLTTKKMNFLGQQLGALGEGSVSETRKIQKLQCKVKVLRKKKGDNATVTAKMGSSGGKGDSKNYIPPQS